MKHVEGNPRYQYKNWTEKEIKKVKKLYNQKVRIKDIAIEMNRTFGSVQGEIYVLIDKGELKHNTKKPETTFSKWALWNETEETKLKKYYEADLTYKEIAMLFPNKTYAAVKSKIQYSLATGFLKRTRHAGRRKLIK